MDAPVASGAGQLALVVLLIGLIVVSIVGNCLVCVAIFTDRRLRKLGNAFIVSLAIADLFVSCLVMTFALCNDLMNYWIFGDWFCDVWISFDIMCCTASILNLCAISLDRFIHIKDCLLYNQWMTRRVALSAVIIIWFISALVSFVPINLGWHRPDYFSASKQRAQLQGHQHHLHQHHGAHLFEHSANRGADYGEPATLAPWLAAGPPGAQRPRAPKLNYSLAAAEQGADVAGGAGAADEPHDELRTGDSLASPIASGPAAPIENQSLARRRRLAGLFGAPSGRAKRSVNSASGGQWRGPDFVTLRGSPGGSSGTPERKRASSKAQRPSSTRAQVASAASGAAPHLPQISRVEQFNQVESNPQDGSPIGPDPGRLLALTRGRRPAPASANYEPHKHQHQRQLRKRTLDRPVGPQWPPANDSQLHADELATSAGPTSANYSHGQALAYDQDHDQAAGPGHDAAQAGQSPQCMLTLTPTYAIISSTISFYIPCIIMLGLYTKLFACARKHVRNIQAISKVTGPIVASQEPGAPRSRLARLGPLGARTWIKFGRKPAEAKQEAQLDDKHTQRAANQRQLQRQPEASGKADAPASKRTPANAPQEPLVVAEQPLNGSLPRASAHTVQCDDAPEVERGQLSRCDDCAPPSGDSRAGSGAAAAGAPAVTNNSSNSSNGHADSTNERATAQPILEPNSNNNNNSLCLTNDHTNQTPEADERESFLTDTNQLSRSHLSSASQRSNASGKPKLASVASSQQLYVQQLQQQQQSGQLATHKAAVTLGIIMGTFLFCWVPFFCLNITKAFCVDCIPSSVFRAFTWLGYANSALNPIIYGIHNTEFRNAFNRIFFKHLNIKSGRHYLNRRFSYDLRHTSNRTISRERKSTHGHMASGKQLYKSDTLT